MSILSYKGLPGSSFAAYLQQEQRKYEESRNKPLVIETKMPTGLVKDISGASFGISENKKSKTAAPKTKAAPGPLKRKVVLEDE